MKKIIYAIAALFMMAGLSSCDGEIKNVKINNLVGTWDLVSSSTSFENGTTTTVESTSGEYIVITENTFTTVSGGTQVERTLSFDSPHLFIAGTNVYDVESLTRNELVLRTTSTGGIIGALAGVTKITYKYARRK